MAGCHYNTVHQYTVLNTAMQQLMQSIDHIFYPQKIPNISLWGELWGVYCRYLTHWGRVTHICVGKQTNIGSDSGLSPGRRQAIIWTNAGISLIGPFRTNFSEILFRIQTFSFKNMHLKMLSAKWCPFCLGLNVLRENLPCYDGTAVCTATFGSFNSTVSSHVHEALRTSLFLVSAPI